MNPQGGTWWTIPGREVEEAGGGNAGSFQTVSVAD